ncbi:MAG: EAL domain-containing protein [Gallionella sp.]
MNKERLQAIFIVTGLIVILTFLFVKTRTQNSNKHNQIENVIQQLRYQDSLMSQGVLMLLTGSVLHDDQMAEVEGNSLRLMARLKNTRVGVYQNGDADTDRAIDEVARLLQRKMRLIEHFESHNAILRNSLYYLPRVIVNHFKKTPNDPNNVAIEVMLRDVLMYNAMPTERIKLRTLALIGSMQVTHHYDNLWLKHAIKIVNMRQSLLVTVDALLHLPIKHAIEKLNASYSRHYERQLKRAEIYRILMYAMAIVLLIYVLQLLLKLRVAMHNLKQMLHEVDFQKYAIDQHAIVATTDAAGLITYVNDKFCEISQYAKAEVIGATHRIVSSTHHPREFFKQMWGQIGKGHVWKGEIKNCRKDGQSYWVSATIVPFLDALGKPERYVAIQADISARKQSEIAQKEARGELVLAASVFSESPMGIMISDEKGDILRVNAAFSAITGYTAAEVIGQTTMLLKSAHHDDVFYQHIWASLHKSGQWEGEIWTRRKNGEIFPEWSTVTATYNEAGDINNYINSFIDITEKKLSEDHVYHLAHYDALTDLPNRSLFIDRLRQLIKHAKRANTKLAVLFLDLDNFKMVNDTLGHACGDMLLQEVAQHLKAAIRETDVVARLGGDEFTITLKDIDSSQAAADIAEKIIAVTVSPVCLAGKQVMVSTSLGISIYPDDGLEAETLLKNADIAMYRAKSEGKNNYQFFTEEMNREIIERHELEFDLRNAIDQRQFVLHYQPQIELASGKLIGVEALIRWRHPEQGMVAPTKFIPVAEASGLIIDMGKWVLEEACRQQLAWKEAGVDIRIAVNVSARQLHNNDLYDFFKSLLLVYKVAPKKLEIELTETSLMDDPEVTINQLKAFSELGIFLALDDFGTGYSSLSYLKRFPIDTLKIDQSFVRDLPDDQHDAVIATTIISMARSLGFRVLAEGVETAEQLAFMHEHGCDDVQGFYFSKPVTANQIPLLSAKIWV